MEQKEHWYKAIYINNFNFLFRNITGTFAEQAY